MNHAKRVLATWGNGDLGRLGHGSSAAELIPKVVSSLKDVLMTNVCCGSAHTLALGEDGSVYTCGLNSAGQLGHSRDEDFVPGFREILLPEAAAQIAAGSEHTLIRTESGDVWSLGKSNFGQLGLGKSSRPRTDLPHRIPALAGAKVAHIAACMDHSLAVLSSGEILSWGSGNSGQLGHGNSAIPKDRDEHIPRVIASLKKNKMTHASAGFTHSGCIDGEGQIWLWGDNRFWQCGDSLKASQTSDPIQVSLGSCKQLELNGNHSMVLLRNGDLMVWGANENGVLGLGNKGPNSSRAPAPVPHLKFDEVASGWKHCIGLAYHGKMYSWGWGGAEGASTMFSSQQSSGGQLGLGNEFDFWKPTEVVNLQFEDEILINGANENEENSWRGIQAACGLGHSAAIVEIIPR